MIFLNLNYLIFILGAEFIILLFNIKWHICPRYRFEHYSLDSIWNIFGANKFSSPI